MTAKVMNPEGKPFLGTTAKILCALRAAQLKFSRFETINIKDVMETVTQLSSFDKKAIEIDQKVASSRAKFDAPNHLSTMANDIADAIATLWNKEQTKPQAQGFATQYDLLAKQLDALSSNKEMLKKDYVVMCDNLKNLQKDSPPSHEDAKRFAEDFANKVNGYCETEQHLKNKLQALHETLNRLAPTKSEASNLGADNRPD